jgi:hypothetical protein
MSEDLRGHEILVASSNNKAVENISRELPGIDAIEPALAPRYFRTTAASVAGEGRDAWGLIAGVLGNAANRVAFRRDFWVDPDSGFRAYLLAASGNEVTFSRRNPETGEEESVVPRVVTEEHPPKHKQEALGGWNRARLEFKLALDDAERGLQLFERVRQTMRTQRALAAHRTDVAQRLHEAAAHLDAGRARASKARDTANSTAQATSRAEFALNEHLAKKPGLLASVFRCRVWSLWRNERTIRESAKAAALRDAVAAREKQVAEDLHIKMLDAALSRARDELADLDRELAEADRALGPARAGLGHHFPDEAFWNKDHASLQTSTPWLAPSVQRLRDLCFRRALELHRAFIDAAAKPIRNNLNALFGVLMGDRVGGTLQAALPSLWSTLFLVVPVLSTTFASVGRMLGPMPPQSLGWLLVDEAGQAVPQAAVGALMRTRRAVIVGDPLQIEPVVTLPLSLVERICRRMAVDTDTWAAPRASAQTLADTASRFQSWFEQPDGAVRVGVPLLVHRRCAQPMFGISNTVAYGGKMVQATPPRSSSVRDVLGQARWFHIVGTGSGKWCPAEGEVVLEAVRRLVREGLGDPDIFVITPFRIVAQYMRHVLGDSDVVKAISDRPWKWARDHVGTVHTFQGREAEAVFLILGAPEAAQLGARNWASHPPNLANVAVSRAKEVLYVVGNRDLWRAHGSFRIVSERLAS